MNAKRLAVPLLAVLALLGAGVGYYLMQTRQSLPPGIVAGNGRLEASEIDIATKIPARIVSIEVEEGDLVEAGQIIARLDAAELDAQLRGAQAAITSAQQGRAEAGSVVAQRRAELTLAEKELQRQHELLKRRLVAQQNVDQLQSRTTGARAALAAAESRLRSTDAEIERAAANVEQLQAVLKDTVLRAPRAGRVLYRLAEPGEVLGAGGRIVTLLDLSDVYMTIFLPANIAGRIAIGAPARILIDAMPTMAIPANVSFVSSRAQFTPKQVETRNERERMVFRIKLRIPDGLVQQHIEQVKTGVLGMAYVRIDSASDWPDWLESDLTRATATR